MNYAKKEDETRLKVGYHTRQNKTESGFPE